RLPPARQPLLRRRTQGQDPRQLRRDLGGARRRADRQRLLPPRGVGIAKDDRRDSLAQARDLSAPLRAARSPRRRGPIRLPMNVAFLGCGYVANMYRLTLPLHPQVRLVAVADRERSRAENMARFTGARCYPDLDAILHDRAIDTV